MKKILLILSFFIICPAFANLYDNVVKLETISAELPELGNIKCKFRQEKYQNNISKPLKYGGDFEFIKGKGVYFYTKYPIVANSDYTSEKYKQINDIVKAISAKKYSKLEKEFSFYYNTINDSWALGMKPKKNSSAFNYISSITLEGREYIKKINITQTNGNKTLLWFEK